MWPIMHLEKLFNSAQSESVTDSKSSQKVSTSGTNNPLSSNNREFKNALSSSMESGKKIKLKQIDTKGIDSKVSDIKNQSDENNNEKQLSDFKTKTDREFVEANLLQGQSELKSTDKIINNDFVINGKKVPTDGKVLPEQPFIQNNLTDKQPLPGNGISQENKELPAQALAENGKISGKTIDPSLILKSVISDVKTIDSNSAEGKLAEGKLAEGKLVEGKLVEGKLVEGKLVEGKLAEGKLTEGKLTEGKLTEGKLVESQMLDTKTASVKEQTGISGVLSNVIEDSQKITSDAKTTETISNLSPQNDKSEKFDNLHSQIQNLISKSDKNSSGVKLKNELQQQVASEFKVQNETSTLKSEGLISKQTSEQSPSEPKTVIPAFALNSEKQKSGKITLENNKISLQKTVAGFNNEAIQRNILKSSDEIAATGKNDEKITITNKSNEFAVIPESLKFELLHKGAEQIQTDNIKLNRFSEQLIQQTVRDEAASKVLSNSDTSTTSKSVGYVVNETSVMQAPQTNTTQTISKAPEITLPANLPPQQWNQKFAQHVNMLIMQGSTKAQIRLDPPELGPMSIRINHNGGETQIQFQVNNPVARDMVDSGMNRLREMLEQQGFENVDVDVKEQRDNSHETSSHLAENDELEDTNDVQTTETLLGNENNSLVDIFA